MYSKELEDEGPYLEHTPFGERAYDFVEQTRSPGTQLDLLDTSGCMMLEGEGKEKGERLYVKERMDGDGEKACSTYVDSNCIESSAGDDEGVLTGQINEGAN